MRNRYYLARAKILLKLLLRRKLTLRKIFNAAGCYWAYWRKFKTSARFPFLISFELWNECNANCVFCRSAEGKIFDLNPEGSGEIPKGKMDFEIYEAVLRQAKDHILMATLYVNGEPLIYKDIYRAVQLATDLSVPSMIATNGILLTKENGQRLLEAGIDFVKIAFSGFSQETYSQEVRFGNIEKIKQNIVRFVNLKKKGNYSTFIMIDFMLYNFNKHELPMVKEFCRNLGVMLSIRPGNPKGKEDSEEEQNKGAQTICAPCDWLWKVMTVNFNGDILACCDYTVWSGQKAYGRFEPGKTKLEEIWNGPQSAAMRMAHKNKGRRALPICRDCVRTGVAFKW